MRRGTLIAILILVALLAAATVFQILRWTNGQGPPTGGAPTPTPSPTSMP